MSGKDPKQNNSYIHPDRTTRIGLGIIAFIIGVVILSMTLTARPVSMWKQVTWYEALSGDGDGSEIKFRPYKPGPGEPSDTAITKVAKEIGLLDGKPVRIRTVLDNREQRTFIEALQAGGIDPSDFKITAVRIDPSRSLIGYLIAIAGLLSGIYFVRDGLQNHEENGNGDNGNSE